MHLYTAGDVGPGLLHHWDVEVADVDQDARSPPEVPHRHPLRRDALHRHRPARPSLAQWDGVSHIVTPSICLDHLRALGPLKCGWTTWFTKYGGPTEHKWSNRI